MKRADNDHSSLPVLTEQSTTEEAVTLKHSSMTKQSHRLYRTLRAKFPNFFHILIEFSTVSFVFLLAVHYAARMIEIKHLPVLFIFFVVSSTKLKSAEWTAVEKVPTDPSCTFPTKTYSPPPSSWRGMERGTRQRRAKVTYTTPNATSSFVSSNLSDRNIPFPVMPTHHHHKADDQSMGKTRLEINWAAPLFIDFTISIGVVTKYANHHLIKKMKDRQRKYVTRLAAASGV